MRIANMLIPDGVIVGMDAQNKEGAIGQLVAAAARGRPLDGQMALKDLIARERAGPTVIPHGQYCVAIPHAPTAACRQLIMAVGTSRNGVPWDPAGDHKANVIIVFLGPPETQALYLRALSRIARLCETADLLERMVSSPSPEELVASLAAAEAPLEEIVVAEGMPSFCVLGAGHGGMAMAAHLSLTGCQVNLWNRTPQHVDAIRARGGIDVDGEVQGFASLRIVTSDASEAVDNADVLMIVVPASAHRDVASAIAPYVKDGQIIVLNPGRTGGALEVAQVFRERNVSAHPYIAEAQTLLYAARATNPGQVHIYGIKNSVPLATLPAWQSPDVLPVIRKALPQFTPGDNVLKTSLDNIGAIFHPAITVLNAGRIEDTHGDFQYYVEGVTPAVAAALEAMDRERVEVAAALGIRANTAREWLYLAYDAAGKTLLDAMRANAGYDGIKAPGTIQHRYISEDVPFSLVPIASLGAMLGVATPAMRSIIQLASVMHGVDYWKEGRTVEHLGIGGMSVKDIRFLVVGAEPFPAPSPPLVAATVRGATASE